ncbi:hypothetical protein PQR15_10690 [Streptomyces lydicus]|nr:hypothetical protein [Streptomyces lydicus]
MPATTASPRSESPTSGVPAAEAATAPGADAGRPLEERARAAARRASPAPRARRTSPRCCARTPRSPAYCSARAPARATDFS